MVPVNTRMIPSVLSEAAWRRMGQEDLRELAPLLHDHVNPYGIFERDGEKRVPLDGPVGWQPDGISWQFHYLWAELARPDLMDHYRRNTIQLVLVGVTPLAIVAKRLICSEAVPVGGKRPNDPSG